MSYFFILKQTSPDARALSPDFLEHFAKQINEQFTKDEMPPGLFLSLPYGNELQIIALKDDTVTSAPEVTVRYEDTEGNEISRSPKWT